MSRHSVREIIPDKLYQRGQILTWPRDKKEDFLKEHGIDIVVNFWRKIDPELTDIWYFHLPSKSEDLVTEDMEIMADTVADLIDQGRTALILCEAGVTRSVWFSSMIVSRLKDISMEDAIQFIETKVKRFKPKKVMLESLDG